MKVSILKRPTEEDWLFCKRCALETIGLAPKTPPNEEWKRKILRARHSPIRELKFAFLLEDIPYWVSVHLCRHVHAQPYVKSQRNDRQSQYDRGKAPQDVPVSMIWTMNAEEWLTICNKRLCNQASKETREVIECSGMRWRRPIRNLSARWYPCAFGKASAMRCTRAEVADD